MWPFRNAASTGLVLKPETNAVAFPSAAAHRAVVFVCHSERDFLVEESLESLAVFACHRAIMLQQNLGVLLLTPPQRAPDGIEPE